MRLIKRKISLEPYRSRVPSFIKTYKDDSNGEGNWGEVPQGLNLEPLSGNTEFKMLTHTGTGGYALSFGKNPDGSTSYLISFAEAMRRYHIIKEMVNSLTWLRYNNGTWDETDNRNYDVNYWVEESELVDYQTEGQVVGLLKVEEDYNDSLFYKRSSGEWLPLERYEVVNANLIKRYRRITDAPTTEGELIRLRRGDRYGCKLFMEFMMKSFGKFLIPENISKEKTPPVIYYADLEDWIEKMEKYKKLAPEDCCTNETYQAYGGDDFLEFLKTKRSEAGDIRELFRVTLAEDTANISAVSCIVVPILITSQCEDNGILSESYSLEQLSGKEDIPTTEPSEFETDVKDFTAVSQLMGLRRDKVSVDDNGNELPGIYDPESTTLISRYQIDCPKNMTDDKTTGRCFGSVIQSIERDTLENKIRFVYIMGGELDPNTGKPLDNGTGIKYSEEYDFHNETQQFRIDGRYVLLDYEVIDFDSKRVTMKSDTVENSNRKVILSKGEFHRSGADALTGEGEYMDAIPLMKEDWKMGITFQPIVEADIYIDRGKNSAYEKFFKLEEVNTYQDLKEYGNNYFNIED